MKKFKLLVSLTLVITLIVSVIVVAPINVGAVANTWNPSAGEYDISTEEDLFAFKDSLWEDIVNKNYYSGITVELKNDIKLTKDWDTLSVANDAEFRGVFKGNNHTISNINCISQDNYCSFFPALYNATIQDLTLSDFTLSEGKYSSAAFASYSYGDVTISNCHLTGESIIERTSSYDGYLSVGAAFVSILSEGKLKIENSTIGENVVLKGDIMGGFIGYSSSSEASIYSCVNNGTICDSETANYGGLGGIIGYSDQYSDATIDCCINYGDVYSSSHYGYIGIGGIGGCVFTSTITNCYNTGDISAHKSSPGVGGIVGVMRSDKGTQNLCSIKNCYNVGKITGENLDTYDSVGGIAGSLTCDENFANVVVVENCHSFSEVNSDASTGEIIGWMHYSFVKSSYSIDGKPAIGKIELSNQKNNIGYFSSADKDGKITYTDIDLVNGELVETRSSQTDENVLSALNKWVADKNAELEAEGNEFRYLTWKMTNPASEDGSKGVTVHPMFGVEELKTLKFHVNQPDVTEDKLFRVYNGDASEAEDTTEYTFKDGGVEEFYNIPKFAEDDYVFAGWYTVADNDDNDKSKAFEFNTAVPSDVEDVYAHWIPVGEVRKDADDDKELPSSMNGKYKGFEMFGVQIRPEANFDSNYGDVMPGGLRFIASISEDLLENIKDVHEDNKIEYGFVSAAESTVNTVVNGFSIDKNTYKLQYNGENVNGVDTTQKVSNANNFRYITNVDCTSQKGGYGTKVKEDHRNFTDYRLATYVVTYNDDESGANKAKNVAARAYLRYTDANGLLRTFYNDYGGTNFYGGCSTSYNAVKDMATNTKTVK